MALGATTRRLTALIALTSAATLALTAGPSADSASAASPCAKYGDVSSKHLTRAQARAAIRCLVNKKRTNRGLGRLDRNRRLQRASQRHTNVMMRKGCFSHQCPGEGSLQERLSAVNYLVGGLLRWTIGENLAWGSFSRSTPKAITRSWMKSPGHRANILNPRFRDLGVGFLRGTPGHPRAHGGVYTTDFGMRIG